MAFVMDKTSNIALYGAGARGATCYEYLVNNQFDVCCIVDKNPDGVIFEYNCPIIEITEVEKILMKDTVIIICLQNGLLHDEIALEFYSKGYNKIIFLPTCNNYLQGSIMRSCYQALLECRWSESRELPKYDEMREAELEQYLIKDDGDMVTCWISMEYIFSDNPNAKDNETWFNKHISYLTPYISLFEYIREKGEYPKEYLTYFRGEDLRAQQQLLFDRVRLWNVYEEKINIDSNYFSSAPICAKWKENHFGITDGHHRAVYLFLKGWYEVPVRTSKEDYVKYLSYKQEQPWERLERGMKCAVFKLCIQLSKWMDISGSHFDQIQEHKSTKGYISHWLRMNQKSDTIWSNKREDKTILYICLESTFVSEMLSVAGKGKIITCETEELQRRYTNNYNLYEGFICDKKERICIYDIKS